MLGILDKFRKKIDQVKEMGNNDHYIKPSITPDDEYLFTLHLTNVTNPLNAKPLWIAEHTSDANIQAKTGHKKDRLWDALNSYRIIMANNDEDYGELQEDPRVFSDVIIWIPRQDWRRAIKSRGVQLSIMVDQLQKRHYEDFKDKLFNDRFPHYCVMPLDGLMAGEVVCQFGLSVFIPDDNDQHIADISLNYHNQGKPFAEWIFWENNRKIKRAAGLYQGQHYLQVAPKQKQTLIPQGLIAPYWFEHHQGLFQINLEELKDDTDLHQQFADDEFVTEGNIDDTNDGTLLFHFLNKQDPNDVLSLRIFLEQATNVQPNTSTAKRLTMMFETTTKSDSHYQLLLKGIALPRFDTGLVPTLSHWQLAFDCQGNIHDITDSSAAIALRFSSYRQKKGLWLQRAENETPKQVTIPQDIQCEDELYRLKKSPLKAHYALLELPSHLPYAVREESMIIGRDDNQTTHTIVLDSLDKPQTLIMNNGKPCPTSMNYLGFSGEHVVVERKKERLYVKQRSHSAPFYILDKDYRISKRFDPKSSGLGEVAVGEYLLIGYYLLQFHQQD